MMSYATVFSVLEELQLEQYKNLFTANLLNDEVLTDLHNSGILTEHLREIVPPLAHRLLILKRFNESKILTEDNGAEASFVPVINCDTLPPHPPDSQVMCKICFIRLDPNWNSIWHHLNFDHEFTSRKLCWDCLFCSKSMQWFSSFKSHTLKHIEQSNEPTCYIINDSGDNFSECLEIETDPTHEASIGDQKIIEPNINTFNEKAIKFVVQLKSTGKLPLSTCQDILNTVNGLFNDMVDIAVQIIEHNMEKAEKLSLINKIKNPFVKVATDYKLTKYLENGGFLIPSKEIVLDSNIKVTKGSSKVKFDTIQCVPIDKVLTSVLNIPGMMNSICEVNSNIETGVYKSPVSGKYLQAKVMNSETPVVLILFYYDEVEVCNPLGSRHGVHKLGNCYFSILNMPQQYLSKVDNLYLCCCFETILLSRYPISRILENTVNELSKIIEVGVTVNSDCYSGKVRVCFGQTIGDNLGLHQILGYTESFVANYPCRFCKMPKYRCLNSCRENPHMRREFDSYNEDLGSKMLSKTGIKSDSILNKIPGFHVTENFCPDLMHDLLEGVGPINVKLVLSELISNGKMTLDQINFKIQSYNYGNLQRDKPSQISLRTVENSDTLLGQSAAQTYCLIQHIPFIFGYLFDESSLVWELFLLFLEIMDIVMSPSVSETTLPLLESLIEDHHFVYQRISKKSLRPKHHHMLHYAEAIRQIGPLKYYWTMRFEAKHKFFKHAAKTGSNFKNIAKTVSNRNQLQLAFKFIQNKPFLKWEIDTSEPFPLDLNTINTKHQQIIQNLNSENQEILCVNSVCVNGNTIKKHDIVLLKWSNEDEMPTFSKVELILVSQETLMVVQNYKTKKYSRHYHSYYVEDSSDIVTYAPFEFDLFKALLFSRDHKNELRVYSFNLGQETPSASSSNSISTDDNTIHTRPESQRIKKRKLFHDEESDFLDIKALLTKHDAEWRSGVGAKIISTAEERQPLPPNLRMKLVQICCRGLMKKMGSNYPSTHQRQQLSECIVEQLFYYMSAADKMNLKLSFFTPSSTYTDATGKRISKTCMGYISSFFRNFWSANKGDRPKKTAMDGIPLEFQSDNLTEEQLFEIQNWLKSNRGPPAKVFDKLNESFFSRKAYLKNAQDFTDIVKIWPRLFDTDSAIQNDFSRSYELAGEMLVRKWRSVAPRILDFGVAMRKSFSTIGILEGSATNDPETAALFMLAFLIRPKNRSTSQILSVDSFIKVQLEADVQTMARLKTDTTPEVFAIGNKEELLFEEVFVIFKGKAVKCQTLLEAIDLAYKSFYVFYIEFPTNCYGAYQFLDYCIYKMKPTTTVLSKVKELSAFVEPHPNE